MKQLRRGGVRMSLLLMAIQAITVGVAEANGPPFNTETAFVTGLQGAAFRSFVRTVDKSAPGRDLRAIQVPLVFPYELVSNRLVVTGAIPYLDKELEVTSGGQRSTLGDQGFGDLSLTAKVRVLQRDAPGATTRFTLLGRVKLPTGEDDERAPDGSPLPPSLQLGTGSVDYSGGAILTSLKQRWGLNGDLIYTVTTSDDGFQFGNSLRYDVALAYRVYPKVYETYPSPQLNLFLEVNGQTRAKNELQGDTLLDSGGTEIFLSPGIQYMAGRTFIVESSLQIPVVQDLSGDQLETDYTFAVGIRWLII